ncbi:MAG: hypothetical protein WC782_00965 [Methylococcaceae bacterium]
MTEFKKDIFTGLMFISGIFGFVSGEFVVSTILFAGAAILSNIFVNRNINN